MKRSFKSFKLPKAIRRVFALLLVCGVFAVAGLAYATGDNVRTGNTQKTRSEVVALFDNVKGLPEGTSATDFAVFANKFTLTSDMEGAIAVNNLEVTGGNIGATTNVTGVSKYTVNIEKTVDSAVNSERKFKVGIYQGEEKTLVKTVEITVPANQTSGRVSINTKDDFSNTTDKYYIYELDKDNNKIENGKSGVMADGNTYVANVSPSSFTIDRSDVYNTSYINNFCGTHTSLVHPEVKATVWVGNDNTIIETDDENNVVENGNRFAIKNKDDQILTLGNKSVVEVKQNLSGNFPINFDTAFQSLRSLSGTIADLKSSDDVKVINMPTINYGNGYAGIDYINATCDGNKIINDENAIEGRGIDSEGKLVIINVDCTNLNSTTQLSLTRQVNIDGQSIASWTTLANNIIWNFYTVNSNNSYGTFAGKITQEKAGACAGVVLAPDAYFYNGSNMNGTVIANETTHNSEYHHIKLTDKNINVTVTNTSTDTGSLKIKKNILVNNTPSNNSTVGNGDYYFDILNSDKTKVVKTDVVVTVTNGVSGETVVSGLEPGDYYVRENTDKLSSNISLISRNDVSVKVEKNSVSQVPAEVSFTNNVVVGSLKITKNVTVNGNSTNTQLADGTYFFQVLQVVDGKEVKVAEPVITITNGNSSTEIVTDLTPGKYKIVEVSGGTGKATIVDSETKNSEITITKENITQVQTASFTNNLNNTGSLKIQKKIADNGQVINDNRADGTYSFKILNESDKQPAKYASGEPVETISLVVKNGESEVYEVVGLEPGDYLIRELNIPNTMELLGGNDKEVKVTANNSTPVETTVFTNNILRGSLKITKKVTVNGQDPSGSSLADGIYKFEVYQVVGETETKVAEKEIIISEGRSSTVTVEGLLPGIYKIKEVSGGSGQAILVKAENDEITITKDDIKKNNFNDEKFEASFTNNIDKPVGSLKIKKNVTLNGSAVENEKLNGLYTFKVYKDGNEQGAKEYSINIDVNDDTIGNSTTRTIQIDDLDPGTYVIEEVSSTNKYGISLVEDAVKVKVEANNTADASKIPTATFTNNLTEGEIEITKEVTLNSDKPKGKLADGTFKFNVTGPNYNETVEIKVTDGEADPVKLTKLKPGEYTISEAATEGFELTGIKVNNKKVEGTTATVKIEENTSGTTKVELVTFTNNKDLGSLNITKHVKINGNNPDGSKLADGIYEFEVIGPNEYSETVKIKIEKGESKTATLENLVPGNYQIKEINTPEDMTLMLGEGEEAVKTVTVEGGKNATVPTAEFTNNKVVTGSLEITKKVTLNGNGTNGKLVDGTYYFNITGPNGYSNRVDITITDGQSNVKTVENLVPGKYTITEDTTEFAGNLKVDKENVEVEITLDNYNQAQQATFTNNLVEEVGNLKIKKNVTLNGKATDKIDGTYYFVVIDENDDVVAEDSIKITKGESNTVEIKGLKPGNYTVREVTDKLEKGMSLDGNNDIPVTVTANNTSDIPTVAFTNNLTEGEIQITKQVTLNGSGTESKLADGTFKFTVTGPDYSKEVEITVEKGKAETKKLTGLKPGTYTISEAVSEGFNLTDVKVNNESVGNTSATVVINENSKENQVELVTFTNNKDLGSLNITKNVKVNGENTTGTLADGTYKFRVTGPNKYDETVEIKIEKGVSKTETLKNLVPGEYKIEEIDTPEDMTLMLGEGEEAVKTVTVKGGKDAIVQTVTFTNNKVVTGSLEITKNVTVNGDPTESQLVDGKYTFEVKDEQGKVVATKEITITGGKSDTAKVEDLEPGKYTVSEVTTGFAENLTVDKENVKVEITFDNYDKTQEVEFTNNLKVDDATLTIKKEIDKDTNKYSEAFDKLYTFKIINDEVADGTKYVANDGVNSITFNNGEATLTIKGDSEVSFAGLKAGEYKVEEIDAEIVDYKLSTDYKDTSGDEDDQTVELTDGQVAMITVTNSYEYDGQVADMSITKVLKNYNQTFKGGTFVFEVTGTKVNSNGETEMIYSGIIGATTDKAGNLSVDKLTNLPVEPGVTYTVKEVYSGSVYSPVNDTVVITLNSQEDIDRYKDENGKIVLTVAFENDYNGTTIGGAGVINIYGLNDGIKQVFE